MEETTQKLMRHYEAFNATDIEILKTFEFDYFPRWNVEEAAQGRHWDLLEFQGKENVWIIGGGTVFESLNHVMGYNKMLLSLFKSN